MELSIKPYAFLPCTLESFLINGHNAEDRDFGFCLDAALPDDDSDSDDDDGTEPFYGCRDFGFFRHPTIPDGVLLKYDISAEEWTAIAEKLETTLSVGECSLCE